MKNTLLKALFLEWEHLLLKFGTVTGMVSTYEDEVYERLSHFYHSCTPLSIHIRYLKPIVRPGKCYDRSLLLSFAFKNPILVIADVKDLELEYGKEGAWHAFIESDGYVYDPTMLLKIKKSLYYMIRRPSNIQVMTKEKLDAMPFIQGIKNTSIDDLRNSLEQRANLLTIVPIIQGIIEHSDNDSFKKEYNSFLEDINYDYDTILKEVDNAIFS